MDALSAMRGLPMTNLQGITPNALQDLASKSIPSDELSKLGQVSGPSTGLSTQGTSSTGAAGDAFSDTLHQFVSEVNMKQAAAGDASRGLLAGNGVSLQQAMIAMEEASVSFQLMVEVRNKLLDSYQELMRMQV